MKRNKLNASVIQGIAVSVLFFAANIGTLMAQSQNPDDVELPLNRVKFYEHANFRGESDTFDLSKFGRNAWYLIDRSPLHDEASSIVVNIPVGEKIKFAEHNPSTGKLGQTAEVVGTGKPYFIDDLEEWPWYINDKISAFRIEKTP